MRPERSAPAQMMGRISQMTGGGVHAATSAAVCPSRGRYAPKRYSITKAVPYSRPLKKRYAPNPEMMPTVTPMRISFLKELSHFFSLTSQHPRM